VNKESQDMNIAKVFESLTAPTSTNEITLKSQAEYSQFSQNTGWMGELNNVDLMSGYMIYLSAHADTLSLVGKSPASDVNISLNPKWNWIGYPKDGILPVDSILGSLTSNAGDIIKSQYEYAEYNENASSWLGDLKFFKPGLGYKLFVASADDLDILKSGDMQTLSLKHEYNMTMTARVDLGPLPASERYVLRTLINDQPRGEVPLTYNDVLGQYMGFVMIHGDRSDVGEEVKSVLWDEYNQQEIALVSSEMAFTIDKINGTANNPVLLSVADDVLTPDEKEFSFSNYPNPFTSETIIRYTLPEDMYVELTVSNSVGKEIVRLVSADQVTGSYRYEFSAAGMAAGIYYCTLKTQDHIETRKLILLGE